MNKNTLFLSSMLVLCTFGITGADAAPSVRMLGNNTVRVGTNAAVVKSNSDVSSQPQQRLGSIRAQGIKSSAPITINKVGTPSTTESAGDDARLSLGKYIHSTGVSAGTIKPVATPSTAGVTDEDLASLVDQISKKQDKLDVDSGLTLENNVVGLNSTYLALPNRVTNLETQMNAKISADDLESAVADAVADEVETQIGEFVDTIYDAETQERIAVTVVDDFTDEDKDFIQN